MEAPFHSATDARVAAGPSHDGRLPARLVLGPRRPSTTTGAAASAGRCVAAFPRQANVRRRRPLGAP
ncbi:MAG: hypothetical protein AVDCRST_MAG19-200 [uncultured Thermomicrobiales bacterium]|uniref:Uncharacterized protein n=1 Tax=uncultured Thermomicrobiales bacterium TaxID=1645740 RepID=A0A6J4UDM9_9BACT|nr:MAG: hypothetical protein AVDCRST_MAG19-200 [uncultured Thermomicrobiales bacterium]